MHQRKIPLRTCLGCNEQHPKKELIRVVRSPEGEVSLDTTGKKAGRGAYLCNKKTCLQKVRKTKRMERTLQCPIPDQVYDAMETELADGR